MSERGIVLPDEETRVFRAAEIRRTALEVKNEQMSIPVSVSNEFIEAAKLILVKLNREYEDDHENERVRAGLRFGAGRAVVGATIIAVENAMKDNAVDLNIFRANFNRSLESLPYSTLPPKPTRVPIPDDDWNMLLETAAADKTFGTFLIDTNFLPAILEEELEITKFYGNSLKSIMTPPIIQEYIRITNKLIDGQA